MIYKFFLFLQLILPATFATDSFAQNHTEPPADSPHVRVNRLDEIVIRDSRLQIPFSLRNRDIAVLDAEVIKTLPAGSVNELLSYIAGVDIRQRGPWGGQADISINGGTFDQTLVLLNGFQVSDPQTGHNMMNLPVSADIIERIEVLKGPAASAYGINALNGAINIITKLPKKNELSFHLTGGSSFEKDTSNGKLFGAVTAGLFTSFSGRNTQHALSVSTLQSSGYRYNTSINNNKVFYQNSIHFNEKQSLQLMGGFVYNDFGANGFYAPPGDKESKEKLQTGIAALRGDFQITHNWSLRPSLNYRYNHDHYIFIRQNPSVYENNHFTNVLDASLNNTIRINAGTLGAGIEYRKELIRSNSLGNRQRDNLGVFAEFGFTKIKDLTVNTGAYLNYSHHFGWRLSPSVDAGYRLNDYFRIFANAGSAMRVPTYTDWYYNGPQNIGNPDLVPEKSYHTEAGIKFSNVNLQASVNCFYRVVDDFIDWVKNDINDPWQPENFQKIKTPGISFNGDYDLLDPASAGSIHVLAGASYTWLAPRVENHGNLNFNYSNYALENLKNQLVLRAGAGFLKYFNATLAGRYEERVNYKSYFLVDVKLEGKSGRMTADININNLTNVTYTETAAVPLPGRWISLGIKWRVRGTL